jgi:hypothetical protein
MAALEGRMLSPKADLLYVENNTQVVELQRARRRLRAAKEWKESEAAVDKRKEKHDTGILHGTWFSVPDLGWGAKPGAEIAQLEIDKHAAKVDELTRVARLESYGRLLRKLEGSGRRIVYFTLTEPQISKYLRINEETFEEEKDPKKRKALLQEHRSRKLGKILTGGGDFSLSRASKNESHDTLAKLNRDLISAGTDEKKVEKVLADAKTQSEEQRIESTYDVNFFFLGDLLQASLDIIYEESAKHSSIDSAGQFGFMLGTMDLVNATNGLLEAVPLSDIPISLSTFNIWFQKTIIEPKRDRLPFQEFVRRICSELIVGALSPNSFGSLSKSENTRTSISNFVLSKNALATGGRQKIWDLRNSLRQQTNAKGAENLKQYLFLYVGGAVGNSLKGNAAADKELGIFHLYSGSDRGAVKKISFKRTDLPGQQEVRISKAKESAAANLLFSDAYRCDITMIGNPVFKPGMLVFVDPTSMGLGLSRNPKSYASLLGIGGYYLVTKVESIIEDGKFETNLSTEAQAPISHLNKIEGSQRTTNNASGFLSTKKPIGEPKDKPRVAHESEEYQRSLRRSAFGRLGRDS